MLIVMHHSATDEQVRAGVEKMPCQAPADGQQFGQMPEHLGKAHDGKPLHGIEALAPLPLHERPPDTLEVDIRDTGAKFPDQTGTQLVAGRLVGDDTDSDHCRDQPISARYCVLSAAETPRRP